MKKIVLLLVLSIILIAPCFADNYIITPSKDQIVSNEKISISGSSAGTIVNISCNKIYGTNSCSGELNEDQIRILKNKRFTIYPNLKVHAFLDQSVPQIQANKVWEEKVNETNLTGKGQTVCIIDTGIDYNHSALGDGWGNKVIAGWRFIENSSMDEKYNCSSNNSACWDDNGHGTHVAGIVASNNTTYKGVAPDSKLVVVKALNGAGSGSLSNVIAGINYCVSNSEEYNISVISMSLGTPDYHNNTYCDEGVPTLTSAINNATAKNISIIVASGNEHNTNAISLPACIQNATPVGSVSSSDIRSSFSNVWALKQIFAPGEYIYSSVPNYSVGSSPSINSSTGWKSLSGTSMATPHVAGAYALINQYLNLTGQKKTPQELENLFISTGVNIDGNENHSRIDPYLTYLNLSFFNVSIEPKKLEFILEPNTTETKNLTINSTKNINITITFSNLTEDSKIIENSNIFAWVKENSSNNVTGNETLTINNVNNTTIYINLTAPADSSGIYTGKININITDNTNSTIVPINIKANIRYKLKKKIEIKTDCGTKNYRIEIGNIKSLVIKGNFSNLTNSYITVKNSSEDKIANSSKTNITGDKIQINNPQSGILEVEFGCLKSTSGNVSNQSVGSMNGEEINATWTFTTSSLELGQDEINLSLTPENTTTSNFNLSTNSTEENVTLSTNDFFLIYSWKNQNISNQSAKNFTFIVPFSSNLIANLVWTNSTNNLTLNLTNLRNQTQTYFNGSGSGKQIIELGANNVSYGIWQARVFGENVSAQNETFNLTIKFLDNNGFKINFTEVEHKFENKTISNGTTKNWTFYVDNNSVGSINVSLFSNATNEINLSLYNSTNLTSGNLINSTKGGNNWTFTTNISEGYWTVLINNTNQTANFTYNLTIHLSGNNITRLGNLTNESSSVVYFNLTSPATKVVDGNYTSVIIITATDCSQNITLNINLSAPILKLRPDWKENYYIGNQTLSAYETKTYNTTRNLFINLNQTKSLIFIVNNSGSLNLTNLTVSNNSFGGLNISLSWCDGKNISEPRNISAGTSKTLNLTIFSPNTMGNYSGWVYLNSSNGQPFHDLNLSLNFDVTNQTLPRLNKTNKVYYFESASNNQLPVGFRIYFFDNQTVDKFWNTSYNFSLVNSTDNSQVLQNLTFNVNSGLFSGEINTTNLTEGENYTIIYNPTNNILLDNANNSADVNLTFELLHNLNLDITSNLDSVVKGYPFDFTINVSKLGNLTAENVSICLSLPSEINNMSALCNNSVGNINQSNSKLLTWVLNGTKRGTYTINITAYSADGRFNKTGQKNVEVKYGNLVASLGDDTPSSKQVNTTFYVYVRINNTGTWPASNVNVSIEVGSTTETTNCSGINIANGSSILCKSSSSFSAGSTATTKDIYVKITHAENATYPTSRIHVGSITITNPSSNNNNNDDNNNPTPTYSISLTPANTSFEISQGGTYDLEVKVKNIGNAKLNNLYLNLTGINSSYYSITPTSKRDLSVNSTLNFEVHFSIPDDFEAKNYTLTLKAISDEKTKTKSITLTVYRLSVEFINITNLTITQGESLTKTFKIKNTGERNLHNLYLELPGVIITPSAKINLSKNTEKEYNMTFSISKSEEIGVKEQNLKVISDEKNFTKKFNLTISPCEEEKIRIKNCYENLTLKFEEIWTKFENAKNSGKNISAIESKVSNANQTLNQIKNYIEQGNYIEAKTLMAPLESNLNSLSIDLDNLEEIKGNSKLLIIVAVIFVIALAGIILFYTFLPKKGYLPGKGYTAQSSKSNFEEKIKNLFKKFKRRKSEEEIIREKKLTEWKKIYDKLKKKKYGD